MIASLPRQLSGTALAVFLHLGAVAWWLVAGGPSTPPSVPVQTLNVSLISAPEEAPLPPAPPQAAPQPAQKAKPTPPRRLATKPRTDTPAAESVPAAQTTQQIAPTAAPAAAAGVPVEAAPAIVPPKFDAAYLANPAPAYPTLSRRLNETGRVLLRVRVSADGLPASIDIAQSSGFPRLDEAAREAVRGWKFIPARQGEQAVAATVNVPIVFKLN